VDLILQNIIDSKIIELREEFIIIDSDKNKYNKSWRGIAIYPPEILNQLIDESIIISSYGSQDSIEKFIKENNKRVEIIKLYNYINSLSNMADSNYILFINLL
jgi:hypothetical protein